MKDAFLLYFLTTAIIQFGILLSSSSSSSSSLTNKEQKKSFHYWSWALILNSTSLLLFTMALALQTDAAHPLIITTIANIVWMFAIIVMILFCRSLRGAFVKNDKWYILIFLIIYGALFEYLRLYSGFVERTLLACSFATVFYLWQIYELYISQQKKSNHKFQYFYWCLSIEIFIISIRMIFSYLSLGTVKIINLSDAPIMLLILLWVQIAFNTMSFIFMSNYWRELISISHKESLLENKAIKKLLNEKDMLTNNLARFKKISESSALAASLSHEINQPLAAIKLNANFLNLRLSKEPITNSVKDIVLRLVSDANKAAKIIQELRNIFKVEDHKTEIIDLNLFLTEFGIKIRQAASRSKINLSIDSQVNAMIKINSDLLEQVFLNLFQNSAQALQEIKRKKIISIKIASNKKNITITFSDNGPGIKAKFINEVFSLYNTHKPKGSGVGLWLCKHIVERAHGTLVCKNNTRSGVSFHLTFPKM
jgi:signal transduction histidine kinase